MLRISYDAVLIAQNIHVSVLKQKKKILKEDEMIKIENEREKEESAQNC